MAVHLDIRPRLTFPTESRAQVRARRRWRLPPLALPALGYWLAMAALTYGFTQLGPNPLDPAEPAARYAPANPPSEEPRRTVETPLAVAPLPPQLPEEVAVAPTPSSEPEATPIGAPGANDEAETEPRNTRKPAAREGLLAASEEQPRAEASQSVPPLSFPEFTDSSRPKARQHAADGPRIDSLFDPAANRPSTGPQPDATPPPATEPDAPLVLSSCEAAIARNNEQLTIGGPRGAPDITREAYANILQNGRYLSACSVPERTVFEICAAVKEGRAVGITIVSNPPSPALNACVRKAVARLKFPQNSRLDVTHTRFDALSR